jgi:hypothetical protein
LYATNKLERERDRERVEVNLLGNLLLATGVILVLAMLYYLLFVMYF